MTGGPLASEAAEILMGSGRTLAVAESCTGGMLASALVAVPGASAWFRGGWIAYADAMKTSCLGVDSALLEKHGAVSEAVVCAMAEGAAVRADADCALAVSGVAGPDGGTPGSPVGTVWIACAGPLGGDLASELHHFEGDRDTVRTRSVESAVRLLLRALTATP